MTDDRMRLAELIQKSGDGDFLRSVAEAVLQMLMEAGVEGVIGAGRHERSAERLTWRNGYRDRTLDTRLGSLQLRIPKLRQGSYFPPFLEARKTSEKALVAVIQEASIAGRGLKGVKLVISDAHEGLKHAIAKVMAQRGRGVGFIGSATPQGSNSR